MAEQFSDRVEVLDGGSNAIVELDAGDRTVRIRRPNGNMLVETILLDGGSGNLVLGGNGQDGDLFMRSSTDKTTIRIGGNGADIIVGGQGHDGDVKLKATDGEETIHLGGRNGNAILGGGLRDGDLFLLTGGGGQTMHLSGENANFTMGGAGQDGDLFVLSASGAQTIRASGDHGSLFLGGEGEDGDLVIRNSAGAQTIHLDGETGVIQSSGADCAERFGLTRGCDVDEGTVLVMAGSADLRPCDQAYDKRVVGIVSGGGDHRPGVILDSSRRDGVLVALVGKVFCKVDATPEPVEVGDLLTTSPLAGHAMKATEPQRAFGAVIGKAMGSLREGRGLLPVLVALQ